MTHPYKSQTKTNQERADARYGGVISPSGTPTGPDPVLLDAQKNPRNQVPDDVYNGAAARQVCNDGKVRK